MVWRGVSARFPLLSTFLGAGGLAPRELPPGLGRIHSERRSLSLGTEWGGCLLPGGAKCSGVPGGQGGGTQQSRPCPWGAPPVQPAVPRGRTCGPCEQAREWQVICHMEAPRPPPPQGMGRAGFRSPQGHQCPPRSAALAGGSFGSVAGGEEGPPKEGAVLRGRETVPGHLRWTASSLHRVLRQMVPSSFRSDIPTVHCQHERR